MKYSSISRVAAESLRFRNAIVLLFCFSLVIVGCQKGDNGTPGDDGAAGATGAQGPAGAKGDKGNKGDSGTANVYYSDWFTPNPYVKDTVFDLYHFDYDQAAASITQSILDSGSVLVYGKLLGYNPAIWPTTQVSQMPIVVQYKFTAGGISYTDTWSALITPGNLRIDFMDDQNYYPGIATAHQFRYIVIPGGVKVTSASGVEKQGNTETNAIGSGSTPNRNWKAMTYEEVCQVLQIPE